MPCHRAHAYDKAIGVALKHQPDTVAALHHEWGDWLLTRGQTEMAVHHFLEAGDSSAAFAAALSATLLDTAAAIIDKEVPCSALPLCEPAFHNQQIAIHSSEQCIADIVQAIEAVCTSKMVMGAQSLVLSVPPFLLPSMNRK